jgi:superfamily II DNA or RNA helicase
MELREHQKLAIEKIDQYFGHGMKRIVLGAPCSFGKTVIASHYMKKAQDKRKSAIFVCDRIKLVDQTIKTFLKEGIDFGVLQANHPMEDFRNPIQVASVQTLRNKTNSIMNNFDMIIIDECHIQYKGLLKWLETQKQANVIGLSATPFSKGLADYFQKLIVPIKPRELLEKKFLAPVRYFVGQSVDTNRVKSKAIRTGGSDFDPDALGALYEDNKTLTGHIVANWLEYGEDKQTIAFCASIKHSKYLVERFREVGVTAEHIDGYTDIETRRKLFEQHNQGVFKILSCSRLLNTGYDEPTVACLIDCFPTKSLINYVQRYGRVMRIADKKPYAIVLDHAQNVKRHGMAEDVIPAKLSKSSERFSENKQVKKSKKKPTPCPQCHRIFTGISCSCGYTIPMTKRIEHTQEMLKEIENELNMFKDVNRDQEIEWYCDLKTLEQVRGYKKGWAGNMYKSKFGVYPRGIEYKFSPKINPQVMNYVKSQQIRYAKSRKKQAVDNFLNKRVVS